MAPVPEPLSAQELRSQLAALSHAVDQYNPTLGPQGSQTKMMVIMKAKELMLSLTDPMDMAGLHVANMMEVVSIRTLLDLGVLQRIPQSGSISSHELANATGVQEALLGRLLRMVASTGFLGQLDSLEFTHTKFSAAYAAMPGPGAMFQLVYDESFLNISRFHEYLREKGLNEPQDQRHSPYAWTEKQEGKTIWEIMEQHPQRFQAFQMGLAHADAAIPTTGYYDFAKLDTTDERPILVDIGGGGGQAIVAILKAHPELSPSKFVLQDLPGPIARAEAAGFLSKEVVKMAHDFETPQPVKGAKAYYLRRTLHDYSDTVCIHILKQIVPAMSSDSVVLISDYVVPERVTPADLPVTTSDVVIFNMSGKERTLDCFKQILTAAGLEFVTVHFPSTMGAIGLVEGRLPNRS